MTNGPGSGLARRAATVAQVMVDDLHQPVLQSADEDHLRKALRIRNGESVSVVDGSGAWRLAAWNDDALQPSGPVEHEDAGEPVHVAFAVVKGERPEWTLQKLTELGVDRITLLTRTDRAVVRWDADKNEKAEMRLLKVAREASMQSRRVRLPVVQLVQRLDDLEGPLALAHHEGPPLAHAVTGLATGPEGGWSERELALDSGHFSMGPTVLRAETAAVTAGVRLCSFRAERTISPG